MKHTLTTLILALTLTFTACQRHRDDHTLRVGTIAGPETALMTVAQEVAKSRYGVTISITTFSDYLLPNTALIEGDIDANVFQHAAFLHNQDRALHAHLVAAGTTLLYPMGLYSHQLHQLTELKPHDTVAIPNDPSNGARALLLLQQAGLITLHKKPNFNYTINDIATNPHALNFVELNAAQLPRALNDVKLAAINNTFAAPAGLHLSQTLAHESDHSPYTNLIVTRPALRQDPRITALACAYHDAAVINKARALFQDGAILPSNPGLAQRCQRLAGTLTQQSKPTRSSRLSMSE